MRRRQLIVRKTLIFMAIIFLLITLPRYIPENGVISMDPENRAPLRDSLFGAIPHIEPSGRRVLLLMIDGLAVAPFETALQQHRLPHIAHILQSRPTVMTQALSTFPSATSPSVPEFVSGRYVELEDLPAPTAVHAFDREQRRVIRYATNPDSWQWPVATLFDATRHLSAVTVFEGRWDGPKSILTQFAIARQAVLEILGVHDLAEGDKGPVEAFLKAVKGPSPPALSLVVLNDFDLTAHFYGPESERALDALGEADALIGQILEALATTHGTSKDSLLDETNIILFGDHGLVRSGQFVDMVDFFRQRDMKAVDVSTVPHVVFRERLGTLWTDWPDVILVSGGSNIAQFYLKALSNKWRRTDDNPDPSADRSGPEQYIYTLARDIVDLTGVDQVLWLDAAGDANILASGNRLARIRVRVEQDQKRFAYILDSAAAADPLDYLGRPGLKDMVCTDDEISDRCFYTRTEWVDRSFDSQYPGAVPLVPKAFHPSRFTGDLMVTLKPGYSFIRGQQGDHGNLDRDAVITPFIANGPDIVPCQERHRVKLVDLYPSVAVLLGARSDDPAFAGLDGRVLDCIKH